MLMCDVEQHTWSEASYSASGSANISSSAREASSGSGRRSTKREVNEDSTSRRDWVKRLRHSYSDEYRGLFNETIIGIASGEGPTYTRLPGSQIGVTLWSSEEKDTFFRSLARRGRHAIQDIAADIGSKSESEVYIYLGRLQTAAADEQTYEPIKKLPKAFDISAAFEISQNCCARLDVAAQSLSSLQQQEEERLEKKKHGSLSLLTPNIADKAGRYLSTGEEGDHDILKALPAAELLNLKTFLALSKRFFMNSSIMENNWRTYNERCKSPTITYTAFSDFHTLTRSITKRIVQSSIFMAMSRRRALNASSNYKFGRHVSRADVMAALDILGMESDTKRLWAGVARKCKLRVYDEIKHRQAFGKRYSYQEIEAILSSVPSKVRGRSRAAPKDYVNLSGSQENQMPDNVSSHSSDNLGLLGSPSYRAKESDDLSDSDITTNTTDGKQANKQQLRETAHDIYAEVLDQRASRAEERRLWELLGENAAERITSEDVELPKMPTSQRKDKEGLDDWKAWVNYAAEWEVYETPVSEISFTKNRSLGRRIERAAGLTGSEVDSEDVVDDSSFHTMSSCQDWPGRKPMHDDDSSNVSFSDYESSKTEEKNFSVGSNDNSVSLQADGGGDSVDDELGELEEEPAYPTPGLEMSSVGGSNEREQMIVNEGYRNNKSLTSIGSNRGSQDNEDGADSRHTDDTDE